MTPPTDKPKQDAAPRHSLPRMVSWRIGQDGKAHGIQGCDPMASAWVAECGALITGPLAVTGDTCCHRCIEKTKAS